MFKKITACFAALLMAFSLLPTVSFAEGFDPNEVSTPYIVLMEASSGTVLFEKNAHEHSFPASTTKVMTCILALEQCPDLDVTVTVGENVETRGSTMGIVRREELSLRSLLYGLMLRSGNDAAKAIAEHISGTESEFANLMNQKAASLGMTDTHFVKSNGLHNEDHYCSAYDMALLTRYAMKNEEFRSIVSAETYDVPPTNKDSNGYQLTNSNKLIYTKEGEDSYEYRYATGVKTGDTDYAGRCLVASAERDGVELILVLFGDYSNKVSTNYRFENAAKFFDWGFANYDSLDPTLLNLETEFTFPVTGATETEITATANLEGHTVTDKKDVIAAIEADPTQVVAQTALTRKLEAPIAAGEVIGTVAYQYQSATLFSVDLVASSAIEPAPIETVPAPSASPLIAGTPEDIDTEDGNGEKGSSLVFWIVLLVVLLVIVLAAKAIATTRRRRRRARKRKAYRSNYNRR